MRVFFLTQREALCLIRSLQAHWRRAPSPAPLMLARLQLGSALPIMYLPAFVL